MRKRTSDIVHNGIIYIYIYGRRYDVRNHNSFSNGLLSVRNLVPDRFVSAESVNSFKNSLLGSLLACIQDFKHAWLKSRMSETVSKSEIYFFGVCIKYILSYIEMRI